jgi:hypothetical protein
MGGLVSDGLECGRIPSSARHKRLRVASIAHHHCGDAKQYVTHPEKKEYRDKCNRIDRLTQRKLRSLSPLVISILESILLQPFWSHDWGSTQVVHERERDKELMTRYGLRYAGPRLPTYALYQKDVGSSPAIVDSSDMIQTAT